MMTAKDLAQLALAVLRVIDKLGPLERDDVLHVARAVVQTEIARSNRPQPVKDE